jgi:hypothetical protein
MTGPEQRLGLLRFLRRTVPALAAVSVVLGLVFGTHFLITRVTGGGLVPTVAAVGLFVVVLGEVVTASALARLEPTAWTVGLGVFAVAVLASLYVLLVESRTLAVAYFLLNLGLVAAVLRMRPLYTPESEPRRRALASMESPQRHAWLSRLREGDPGREVVLFVAFVALAAAITFYQGVKLYFRPDELSTTVGTTYVGFALLQARACYGLWLREGRAWVLSMLLCTVATLVAAYHALVATDMVSFAILLVDASIIAGLYRIRGRYVGEIAVGRPPA